jgi:hypothetical protein
MIDEYEAKVKIWNNYLEERKKKKKNIKPPVMKVERR